MIGLKADAGDNFRKRASIPLAPCKCVSFTKVNSVLYINLIWFGYIARLFRVGGEGYSTRYLPSLRLGEGGGGSAPCGYVPYSYSIPPEITALHHIMYWPCRSYLHTTYVLNIQQYVLNVKNVDK